MMETVESSHDIVPPIKLSPQSLSTQTYCMAAIDWVQAVITLLKDHQGKKGELDQYVQYVWSLEVKEVSLLLRNVGLGMMKIDQFVRDGKKSDEDFEAYKQESRDITAKAIHYVQAEYNAFSASPQEPDPTWKHQISPLELIVEQLDTIVSQIKKVQRSDNKLDDLAGVFDDFRKGYQDVLAERLEYANNLTTLLTGIRTACLELTDTSVNKLIVFVDKQLLKLESIVLNEQYEDIALEDVEQLALPFADQAGRLCVKRVDILSEVSNWTASHLWPELRTADKHLGKLLDRTGIYLFQFSNQLKAKLDEEGKLKSEVRGKDLAQSIKKLENEISPKLTDELIPEIEHIQHELKTLLTTSQLFDKEANFLPGASLIQMSSTVASNLVERYNQSSLVKSIRQQLAFSSGSRNNKGLLQSFIASILDHEDESEQYSLFKRTGYMGASFTVNRIKKEETLNKHFALWQEGFGGALCIRGAYGSGRSTLLGKFMSGLPKMRSYTINIGESIDVEGHKVPVSKDLGAVLKAIQKYSGRDRAVVAIDNFEAFADNPEALFEVFRQTQAFIRREARHIYLVLVLSNYSYRRLGMLFPLNEIFTTTVVADGATDDIIAKALLTRAQAVFRNQQEDSFRQFSQKARHIVRFARGNMGLAMTLWGLRATQGSAMIHPDFDELVERYQLILEMAAMQGQLQTAFSNRMLDYDQATAFKDGITTLLAYKILLRSGSGFVMINPEMRSLVETSLENIHNERS